MKATDFKARIRIVALLLPVILITQAGRAQDSTLADNDIVNTLKSLGSYTWLVSALDRAGLSESLRLDGPFTLFAPTDAAAAALPEDALTSMSNDSLLVLLRYHILTDVISEESAVSLGTLMTAQGGTINAEMGENGVRINDATIVNADIKAGNGVIHSIDAVLIPPKSSGGIAGTNGAP